MISILFNGENKTLDRELPLSQAIESLEIKGNSFAIAINENFIPKSNYGSTVLHDGDQVELLVPMQGG